MKITKIQLQYHQQTQGWVINSCDRVDKMREKRLGGVSFLHIAKGQGLVCQISVAHSLGLVC